MREKTGRKRRRGKKLERIESERCRDRDSGACVVRDGEPETFSGHAWGRLAERKMGGARRHTHRGMEGERKERRRREGVGLTHRLPQGPPEEDEEYPSDHEGTGCSQ